MKHRSLIKLAVIAAFLTTAFTTAALTQTPAGGVEDQSFAPGMDDLMTMLVQPRHMKLYAAGAAKNWELAAAESRDLRASFGRISGGISSYSGNDVNLSISIFVTPMLDAMDSAIAAANSEQFAAAYDKLTTGCNDCHTYMEHPFLVIKKPEGAATASPFLDQDFKPNP